MHKGFDGLRRLSRAFVARLRAGRFVVLFLLSVILTIVSSAGTSEGARRYTLTLSTSFGYETAWGYTSGSAFTQYYTLSTAGNIIDPRLATFQTSIGWSKRNTWGEQAGNALGDFQATSFGLVLSMLNGINSGRGLKVWNYIPRPIVYRFDYSHSTDSDYYHHSVSTYYNRPGYLKILSGGNIIKYSETKDNTDATDRNINKTR